VLAFNLEGWTATNGSEAYRGKLQKGNQVVIANVNSNRASFITRELR
jgi:hypothetical protein